jgi:hypothetical protein
MSGSMHSWRRAALAAVIAITGSAPAVLAGDPATENDDADAMYAPVQALSYTLGSKQAVGYFVTEHGECQVTLMVGELVDPDFAAAPSAARLRLPLRVGQTAGVDSAEGHSLEMTCGPDAATLLVHVKAPAVTTAQRP